MNLAFSKVYDYFVDELGPPYIFAIKNLASGSYPVYGLAYWRLPDSRIELCLNRKGLALFRVNSELGDLFVPNLSVMTKAKLSGLKLSLGFDPRIFADCLAKQFCEGQDCDEH